MDEQPGAGGREETMMASEPEPARASFEALWEHLNHIPHSQYGSPVTWLMMAKAWALWFWIRARD